MTEEEIKVKYVLPWLKQTGVGLHEIQLERTFSLKIGRNSVVAGHTKERKSDTISGRLDILVQRDGRNLLIVETKADGLQLTDDDRDQAISYARLVHPIAPYAVVTNGRDYRLYDSITKLQINPREINFNGFEATLPEDDILEAASFFLALNPANLIAFCRSQIASELRIVKGTLTDGRKYIPEIHAPRDAILTEAKKFYSSSLPGLLLTGQSGAGKTCELCWLAESLLESGKPVLFFNSVELRAGIIEAIAEEFSWTFSGSDLPIQVVRRMAKLAGNERLTIIVDAIDEWIYPSRENYLGSLLSAAENNNIKIIVSCKSSAVEKFISKRGDTTKIDLLTKKVEAGTFSEKEFYTAIDKYRQAYQFFGAFEDAVLNEARSNPFLLRVFFDVAKNSKLKHLTFSSAEFFEAFFHRSIDRTTNVRQAENTLKAIARLVYQHNTDWIPEDDIRTSLGLRVNESIMDELFEYGILLRSETDTGISAVGFYFQQLRDYIIAFKFCQFHTMPQQRLAEEFSQLTELGVRADVFTLYYRLASREHKVVLDGDVRENATHYLHCYTSLIQQHFPVLRETFKPETEGRVGFIGELLLVKRHLGCYGFRPLGESDEEIHFVPVQQKTVGRSNLSYLEGADQLHWTSSACGFRDGINVTAEVIDNELFPQLEEFIKEGRLNESQCPEMLMEFIVETILRNKKIFKEVLNADGQSIKYPIKLDEVLKPLLWQKLIQHFQDVLISTKRRNGEIEEVWNGNFVSYSTSFTAEDEKQISNAVKDALDSGHLPRFHARYIDLEKLESSLTRAINWLRPTKAEIDGPLFENESKLKTEVFRHHPISNDDAKNYLIWLYSAFLKNYKSIIEMNFPTLKQHFRIYSIMPVSVHLVLGGATTRGIRSITPLVNYFSKSQNSTNGVKVVDDLVCNMDDHGVFSTGGTEFQSSFVQGGIFENLFSNRTGRMDDPFKGMTLRRLVYETIANELKAVKQAFRTQCKNVDNT